MERAGLRRRGRREVRLLLVFVLFWRTRMGMAGGRWVGVGQVVAEFGMCCCVSMDECADFELQCMTKRMMTSRFRRTRSPRRRSRLQCETRTRERLHPSRNSSNPCLRLHSLKIQHRRLHRRRIAEDYRLRLSGTQPTRMCGGASGSRTSMSHPTTTHLLTSQPTRERTRSTTDHPAQRRRDR